MGPTASNAARRVEPMRVEKNQVIILNDDETNETEQQIVHFTTPVKSPSLALHLDPHALLKFSFLLHKIFLRAPVIGIFVLILVCTNH